MTDTIVIVAAKRTPIGGFMGALATIPCPVLGASVIEAIVDVKPQASVDEVIMGCVLPAGIGQAPARQAAIGANLPMSAGATTINKVCGSGMKAIMLAHDLIKAGSACTVIAGGMENMSLAPYLLNKARAGYRMGHGQTFDHMMLDGLENAYDGKSMGCFAQSTADSEGITRVQMDEFAINSLIKAQTAIHDGTFKDEIVPITINTSKGDVVVDTDEGPSNFRIDKIASLRAAFTKDGTVTAANSSSISDGAAALLIMSGVKAAELGCTPLAKIIAHSTHSIKPEEFTIAPVGAVEEVLLKAGWKIQDVDLFEINEAFAMVTMLAINKLGIDRQKVNVKGGACALGHPIGASGARIVVTLIHALKQKSLKKGIATLCIGGGEGTALAIEIL